jgi:hypothetical protein
LLPVEAALSVLMLAFVLKTIFSEGINENKGDCHQCHIISVLKMSILKRFA